MVTVFGLSEIITSVNLRRPLKIFLSFSSLFYNAFLCFQDLAVSEATLSFIKDSTIHIHKIVFPRDIKKALLKVTQFSVVFF